MANGNTGDLANITQATQNTAMAIQNMVDAMNRALSEASKVGSAVQTAMDTSTEATERATRANEQYRASHRATREELRRATAENSRWNQVLNMTRALGGRGSSQMQNMVRTIRELSTVFSRSGAAAGELAEGATAANGAMTAGAAAAAAETMGLALLLIVLQKVIEFISNEWKELKRLGAEYARATGQAQEVDEAHRQLRVTMGQLFGYWDAQQDYLNLQRWAYSALAKTVTDAMGTIGAMMGTTILIVNDIIHGHIRTVEEYEAAYTRMSERLQWYHEQMVTQITETMDITAEEQSRIADTMIEAQDALQQGFAEIGAAMEQAQRSRAQALKQIEMEHVQRVTEIEQAALQSRGDAFKQYYRRITELQRSAIRDQQQEEQRHAMDVRHAYERHYLNMIQSERRYQWERLQLVAEGDVLAIEELDQRYQLERQEQEENFQLQMRQQEEMWRLQRALQQVAIQEQLQQLREGLAQQLQEIEQRRQEQLQQEAQSHRERTAQAEQSYADEVERVKQQHARLIQQERDRWVQIAQQYQLGRDQLTALVQATYGPGSVMDQVITAAYLRWVNRALQYRMVVAQAIAPSPVAAGGPVKRGQYGLDFFATRPTTLMVGERGMERVIVQPMYGALRWAGGPIPVIGHGLEGANLSAVGEAIAQGILMELLRA